jgi:hypothetical protein
MWARDFLIINGICHAGELIRRYRCCQPIAPIPATSNAVLVQLQGKDKFGKLQTLSLMQYYRVNIQGTQYQMDIRISSGILRSEEMQALRELLKHEYPKAYARSETQAVLGIDCTWPFSMR